MGAIKKFLTSENKLRPLVLEIDTSKGDGQPNWVIPIVSAGGTLQVSVNGGQYQIISSSAFPIISLIPNSINIVKLLGELNYFQSGNSNTDFTSKHAPKVVGLLEFGTFKVGYSTFRNLGNLIIKSTDTPKFETSIKQSFSGVKEVATRYLNDWDFSKVVNADYAFFDLKISFQNNININSNTLTSLQQTFRLNNSSNNKLQVDFTFNTPNVITMRQIMDRVYLGDIKIKGNTESNTDLYRAFAYNGARTDLSELNVQSVYSNNSFIFYPLDTDIADNMLVKWSQLPRMVSGVDWDLRGSEITSLGQNAINNMETNFGNTFSNYIVI